MKSNFRFALLYFPLMVIANACNSTKTAVSDSAYTKYIDSLRKEKNNEFAIGKNSPFAATSVEFEGLNYYPVNPAYRVKPTWSVPDTTFLKQIADSKGGVRAFRFSGDLNFELNGNTYSLPVWVQDKYPDILFIMFRDLTNGNETYGGGRYIEIHKPNPGEELYLDFNQAFNPYCHYSAAYSCPIVPKEQFLKTEIKAGEKLYFKDH